MVVLKNLLELKGDHAFEGEHFHFWKQSFVGEEIPEITSAVGVLRSFWFHGWSCLLECRSIDVYGPGRVPVWERCGIGHGKNVSQKIHSSSAGRMGVFEGGLNR